MLYFINNSLLSKKHWNFTFDLFSSSELECLRVISKMKCFRNVQNIEEQRQTLENAVPSSTKYSTKWAIKIFEEWQKDRLNKDPVKESFPWEVKDITVIQELTSLEHLSAESLDFWLVKFLQEVAKQNGEPYPQKANRQ